MSKEEKQVDKKKSKNPQPHKDNNGRLVYDVKYTKCKRCGEKNVAQKFGTNYTTNSNGKIYWKYKKDYCDVCGRKRKSDALRKANRKNFDKREKQKLEYLEKVDAPDGTIVYLKNEQEKKYYCSKLKRYNDDYDLTNPADESLLARLLTLEVESLRVEQELLNGKKLSTKRKKLMDIAEAIRRLQKDLGIDRASRQKIKSSTTPEEIVERLIEKFRIYREKHVDEFTWVCSECGQKHVLHRRNKGWKKGRDPNRPKPENIEDPAKP